VVTIESSDGKVKCDYFLETCTSLGIQRDTHCEIRRWIYSGNFKHCGVYRNVFRQETIIADV